MVLEMYKMILLYCFYFASLVYGAHIPRKLDPKIVGGNETTIDKVPYQVSVQLESVHQCGGSIINENTVITAAHCTDGKKASQFSIKAGVTSLLNEGNRYSVKKLIQHEYFSIFTADYDIAILKLGESIKFNTVMKPIALQASRVAVPTGTKALISGWGALREGEFSVKTLRWATTKVIDWNYCKEEYYGYIRLTDNMMCAQVPGIDACQGDSGGPLVAGSKLIGVVSWGRGCAQSDSPGVFTKISELRTWIDTHINDAVDELITNEI